MELDMIDKPQSIVGILPLRREYGGWKIGDKVRWNKNSQIYRVYDFSLKIFTDEIDGVVLDDGGIYLYFAKFEDIIGEVYETTP